MATKLPSKLPGGNKRRFENRQSQNKSGSPFSKSHILSSPQSRAANTKPEDQPKSGNNSETVATRKDSAQNPNVQRDIDNRKAGKAKENKTIQKTNTPTLAERENSTDLKAGNSTAVGDKEEKSFYSPDGKSSKKKQNFIGRISRNKKIGFGFGSAGIVGLVIFGLTVLQGPIQLLDFANILSGAHFASVTNTTEGRLGSFYRYLRYPDNPEQRRLGPLARRSAAKVEASFIKRGLTPQYDGGRLTQLNVRQADLPALRAAGLGPDIVGVDTGNPRIIIDPPGTNPRTARARLGNVTNVVRSLDVKVGHIGTRSLRTKAGIGFLNISTRRTVQDLRSKYESYRTKKNSDVTQGRYTTIDTSVRSEDPDLPPDDPNRVESDRVQTSGTRVEVEAQIKRAAGGLAAVGLVCAAYQIADSAEEVRKSNVILPLMRLGMRGLTIASQLQANAVDLDEAGFFIEELYDETAEIGSSWKDSQPIQGILGTAITGVDLPESAHPTRGGNFILQAFRDDLPSIVGATMDPVCGFVTSTVGQVISIGVDLFTGGISAAVKGLAQELIIGQFAGEFISLLSGDQVSVDGWQGGLLAAGSDYGVMLAAQETMITHGGRELSDSEFNSLAQYNQELEKSELAKLSFSERYFSLSNPDSLAFKTLASADIESAPHKTASLLASPLASFSNVLSSISNIGGGSAYAAPSQYDYGIPRYGFSLEELSNPAYDNPLENEEIISSRLPDFREKIETCFGVTLNTDLSVTPIIEAVRVVGSERDSAGCEDQDEEWTRVRFYMLDSMVMSSYACYDEIVSECQNVGLQSSQTVNAPPSATPDDTDFIWPLPGTEALTACWNDDRTGRTAGYFHSGLDIRAAIGTNVLAPADGTVITVQNADPNGGFGRVIIIQHANGYYTQYQHLDSIRVSVGQQVTQGEVIAISGDSGSPGSPHLHFNIQRTSQRSNRSNQTLNPLDYLPDDGRFKEHVRGAGFAPPELVGKTVRCVPSSVDVQGWILVE